MKPEVVFMLCFTVAAMVTGMWPLAMINGYLTWEFSK
jgi:hypothetical protein